MPSLARHPLKNPSRTRVIRINTDDLASLWRRYIHEYTVAALAAGLSREQIQAVRRSTPRELPAFKRRGKSSAMQRAWQQV